MFLYVLTEKRERHMWL